MRLRDYHELPRIEDSVGYLYVEHARVDREARAIAIHDEKGLTPVPCAGLCLLMLGPGTRITHSAIETLADCGCTVAWCGEQGVRFYATGLGETRNSRRLLHQARLATRRSTRLAVVRRLYEMRFPERLDPELTLQQLRGMEGVRVRDAYYRASKETGVKWSGRQYDRSNWAAADPVNRALSAANACLYGVCHAAIVASGYSAALGFIHTGKMLSFVYDVADLYKVEMTIPVSFQAAALEPPSLERHVRLLLRDTFARRNLLARVVTDIDRALDVAPAPDDDPELDFDADPALPGPLWDGAGPPAAGGEQHAPPPATP